MHEAPAADEAELKTLADAPVRTETPLPWKTVLVLGIVILSDSISGTVIFPFQGFMVDDFRVADSTTQIGYYAGFLGSSYFIAQIFCSYFYGWLSDRLGRRPILLFGLCGSTLSILMLGISPNIFWAIGWRFANGILNGREFCAGQFSDYPGNVGVAKTYMAEITDETNQARGFGSLSLIWNLGNILGPVIGGFLARPHLQAPWKYFITEDSLLGGRYPYLLPCLVAGSCTTFGLVMGILFLPETLRRNHSTPTTQAAVTEESDAEALLANSDSSSSNGTHKEREAEKRPVSAETSPPLTLNTLAPYIKSLHVVHLLGRRKVVVAIGLYMILGFADVMFEEVFPLWSLNPPSLYGLGFLPWNIGLTTALGSVLLLAYNIFGYPMLEAIFRPLGCFQLGYSVAIPALMFYPSVYFLVQFGKAILWAGVMLVTFTVFIAISTAYMSVFILIANCAPAPNLSRVNGIAQTGVAIGRTISPVLGGTLLAWSLNNGLTYPFNFYFSFVFMAAAHGVGACLSFLLPPSINERAPMSELIR